MRMNWSDRTRSTHPEKRVRSIGWPAYCSPAARTRKDDYRRCWRKRSIARSRSVARPCNHAPPAWRHTGHNGSSSSRASNRGIDDIRNSGKGQIARPFEDQFYIVDEAHQITAPPPTRSENTRGTPRIPSSFGDHDRAVSATIVSGASGSTQAFPRHIIVTERCRAGRSCRSNETRGRDGGTCWRQSATRWVAGSMARIASRTKARGRAIEGTMSQLLALPQ